MPQTPHIERHFNSGEVIRDIVIGMSDGLTVPFALAAGLSGAVVSTQVIVVAGLAEIAAGSIAMGLGGFLAARGDAEHYAKERQREEHEVLHSPQEEQIEVEEIFAAYGLSHEEIEPVVAAFRKRPAQWVDFMMRFELGLEAPAPRRAIYSGITIALSYVAGGFIPLSPYMILARPVTALGFSVGVTMVALAVFGYIKGRFTGTLPWKSAGQTFLIGALAAGAAFAIAKWIS